MKLVFPILTALLVCVSAMPFYGQARRQDTSAPAKRNTRPVSTPTPAPSDDPGAAVSNVGDTDGGIVDPDVIKIDTRLVTIPVRAVDKNGRFVSGLAKEDFKVLEDGAEQEVAHFSNEAQPFTVALVLDMSYSATLKVGEIQAAAISFVDQLRPNDRIMVVSFAEEVNVLCAPTSDRQVIRRAIGSTRITTGTSVYEAVDLVINRSLRGIEGRKAIILFSDGVDTTSRRVWSRDNLRDATELDALIYPIRYDTFADVQSLKNKTVVSAPPPTIPGRNSSPFPFPVSTIGTPDSKGTTMEEYAAAEEYLDQLAYRTGGRVYVARTAGSLTDAFNRIASELREFYSLGYYPSDDGPRGKTRKIKVRSNKPGITARSREGYTVPANTR